MWSRITGLGKDCQGFVVVSTLAIFLFLFILCAFVYAVGETIHQRIKMQNACDAAAYSAAVVQADGLSRMATINRAMAWSYVQMTNRQMDYITYRWLKLTVKRFEEDKANARSYADQITLCVDPKLGVWAILEALISGVLDRIFDLDCSSGNGHSREKGEGRAWWCGLKYGKDEQINLNISKGAKDELAEGSGFKGVLGAIGESVASNFITKKTIKKILEIFDFIDSGDSPAGWGNRLGKLIDHDKANIRRMNNALARINKQMNVSMKMTAESVLKSMLKDRRYSSEDVLKNYFISIHIPEGKNPYETDSKQRSAAPESFFSPLRNTEVDEMTFLNMQSTESAGYPLHAHFSRLLVPASTGKLAGGIDQWFIRGTGIYNDNRDDKASAPCYASQKAAKSFDSDTSAWVTEKKDLRLLDTQRDEGSLGIQRVYKSSNLNESGAGFWNNKNARGNHLIDITALAAMGIDAVKGFFSSSENSAADESDEDPESLEDIIKQYQDEIQKNTEEMARLEQENQALRQSQPAGYEAAISANNEKIRQLREKNTSLQAELADLTSNAGSDITPGGGTMTPGSGSVDNLQSGVSNFFSNFVSTLIGNFGGRFLDITPSVENVHLGSKNFMCTESKVTTALYSEYRWASSKWYCCTKLKAYSYSLIFGAPTGSGKSRKHIYCDIYKYKFASLGFKARGWGHYAFFPKWFCGGGPTYPGNSFISGSLGDAILGMIPPLTPESITGNKHGYMSSPLDMTGLVKPMKCLFGNTNTARDDYHSCAAFPDGPFTFARGSSSYAGFIQGHARIYADDKEIFDNRYVGARCKPWVLNERFFAGDGTIVIGAAMKHTNPFVQLFNLWNTQKEEKDGQESYVTGSEPQENADKTVLAAFNIPKDNFMWTMSAARAGVRHCRRNGQFDQERQYQITYDSLSDAENLRYANNFYAVMKEDSDNNVSWDSPEKWGNENSGNSTSISRFYAPGATTVPVWNGCVCKINKKQFNDLWNLCETDWDATLLPLRYAGRKATLYLSKNKKDIAKHEQPFNQLDYSGRQELIELHYANAPTLSSSNGNSLFEQNDMFVGNGQSWEWESTAQQLSSFISSNPFVNAHWKKADASFFENLFLDAVPGAVSTGISYIEGFNLRNKIPTGKEEKKIDPFTIFLDKVL